MGLVSARRRKGRGEADVTVRMSCIVQVELAFIVGDCPDITVMVDWDIKHQITYLLNHCRGGHVHGLTLLHMPHCAG